MTQVLETESGGTQGIAEASKQRAAAAVDAATCRLSQDAMVDLGNLLTSLSISLAEAAWRGSPGSCRLHLIEVRATLKTAAGVLLGWEKASPHMGGGD